MHGAANDFILVDDRVQTFPAMDRAWLASVMARRTGVGAEGTILIQPSEQSDFRMRFFNPDGSEVEMCGNGARCVARLAHELGIAPPRMTFDTVAGRVGAEIIGEQVRLQMTRPKEWRMNINWPVTGAVLRCHFVNSGVPHAVIPVADLDRCDVAGLGRAIRHHAAFAPAGANANFIRVTGPNEFRIRTYERGVEAETLACGTGMVAAALVAGRMGLADPPMRVRTAGGDDLTVDFERTPDGATNVLLTGPAEYAFTGRLAYRPNRGCAPSRGPRAGRA
jgi:diaminopimelate epimerase